jgi:hypothetical protein
MNAKKINQDKCGICNEPLTATGICEKCNHNGNLALLFKLLVIIGFFIVLYLNQIFGPFDIERPW